MAAATFWQEFYTFALTTGEAYPAGIRDAINELALQRYTTLGDMLRGKPMHRIIDYGASIKTPLDLELDGDYGGYTPGQPISWHDSQPGVFTQSHWRAERGTCKWIRAELKQQFNGAFHSGSKSQTFQRVYDLKIRRKKTYMANYIERSYWRTPDATKMEVASGSGLLVKSIPSGLNEWRASVHGVAGDGLFPGYTTFQDLNPNDWLDPVEVDAGVAAPRSLWAPRVLTYSELGTANTAIGDHLIEQMDRMLEYLAFAPVPLAEDLSEPRTTARIIYSDLEGVMAYKRTLRAHNELFGNKGEQDLFHNPTFSGMRVRRVAVLDSMPLYPNVNGGAITAVNRAPVTAGNPDAIRGPRYYFVNPEYFDTIWDGDLYFADSEVFQLKETAPDTFVMLTENQRTNHFWSRQRHGVLAPNVDQNTTYV